MTEPQTALFPASEIPSLPPGMPKIGTTRPSSRDPILIKMAAMKMARTLCESGTMGWAADNDIEAIADDLAACPTYYHNDGYKFASYLEDNRRWDCDFAITEHLDDFLSVLDDVVSGVEALWMAENNIQPPFPIGTKVHLRGETGVIDSIYEHGVARYAVKIDGDPAAASPINRRCIVKFEDAVAIESTDS